jgi:hypothetical protein
MRSSIVIDTKVEQSNNCVAAAVFLQHLDMHRQPLVFLSSPSCPLVPGWNAMRACRYMPFVSHSILSRYAANKENTTMSMTVKEAGLSDLLLKPNGS